MASSPMDNTFFNSEIPPKKLKPFGFTKFQPKKKRLMAMKSNWPVILKP
jgi:hypothetical protein